jgi:hypothetical protein
MYEIAITVKSDMHGAISDPHLRPHVLRAVSLNSSLGYSCKAAVPKIETRAELPSTSPLSFGPYAIG